MNRENPLIFGLVPGAWHGAWCWELLQSEIDSAGHNSIAIDLPISDPEATFDDYADTVVDAIKDNDEIVLVGHSRAGNILPRVAGITAVKKLIYVCGSFEPATLSALDRPIPDEIDEMPRRNRPNYRKSIKLRDDGLTEIAPDVARELFYSGCSEKIKDWAVAQLRPQRRSNEEPTLEKWPEVPQESIICSSDLVTKPDWQRYVAQNWLGIDPTELRGGHSPMLQQPRTLAAVLIRLGASND
ncbi:MAG TPA: alpha/beta hydrolase [Patescibacteria group bacterium]|nr:alpha/beta hydrolase [Patescibacteria group bacterium]